MTAITVRGIPGSPFLRAVEVTLKEKDVAYHLHAMSPADMKTPEHYQLHPFGRIPILEHDGFRLYETQAIVRYLDDVFVHPRLTPGNARGRARMNQVIGIIEWYLFPMVAAPIGFNRIIGPKLLGLTSDEIAIEKAMPMARTCFSELSRLLGDQHYLTGDSLSIADVMLGTQLDLLTATSEGQELITCTNLEPWLKRLKERGSFQTTEPPAILVTPALAA